MSVYQICILLEEFVKSPAPGDIDGYEVLGAKLGSSVRAASAFNPEPSIWPLI